MALPKQIKSKILSSGGSSAPGDTTMLFDFTNLTGMSYGPGVVGTTNGSVQLINLYGPNAYFVATFGATICGNWSRNNGPLGCSIVGGVAGLTIGGVGFNGITFGRLMFNPMSNFPTSQAYAAKMTVVFGYTGAPATEQTFLSQARNYTDSNWQTNIRQQGAETHLRATIQDDSFTKSLDGTPFLPAAGSTGEIELNVDVKTPAYRLFFNGLSMAASTTTAGTRDGMGRPFLIGQNAALDATHIGNFVISKFMLFDAVLHTAAYTPGYTCPETPFSILDETIETTTIAVVNTIVSVGVDVAVQGSDLVKSQVRVGGTLKYWSGAAWVASDGTYAQSNTIAQLIANAPALSTGGGTVSFRFHLHSATGLTTPYLSAMSVEYT